MTPTLVFDIETVPDAAQPRHVGHRFDVEDERRGHQPGNTPMDR